MIDMLLKDLLGVEYGKGTMRRERERERECRFRLKRSHMHPTIC